MTTTTGVQRLYLRQMALVKRQYGAVLCAFRVGDFIELYAEDAETAAAVIDFTLATRGGVPVMGFPASWRDHYFGQLNAAGHLVALLEREEHTR